MRNLFGVILILLSVIVPQRGRAEAQAALLGATRTSIGFDFQAIQTNVAKNLGWLAGGRLERYLGASPFRYGLGAYYGTPTGGTPSKQHILLAGVSLGLDLNLSSVLEMQMGVLMGYGEGVVTDRTPNLSEKSYFMIDPQLAFGVKLGDGWRILMTGSYLDMNGANDFTGISTGLRFEYHFESITRSSN